MRAKVYISVRQAGLLASGSSKVYEALYCLTSAATVLTTNHNCFGLNRSTCLSRGLKRFHTLSTNLIHSGIQFMLVNEFAS
jgi:hypothetical protein